MNARSATQQCEWSSCKANRWSPYSWHYCLWHLLQNAQRVDEERQKRDLDPIAMPWVRDRICGVLNGYTSHLGDVSWRANWVRPELVGVAEDLGLALDSLKEAQWRSAQAVTAEAHPHRRWNSYDRYVPLDYQGPGARIVAKTNRAKSRINSDYEGRLETGAFN